MTEIKIDLSGKFTCPRRMEDGTDDPSGPFKNSGQGLDSWHVRNNPDAPGLLNTGVASCSYCGSMHQDDFMKKVREGWEVGPTDKSYKAYLRSLDKSGPESKFYFQHLTADQRREFIQIYNDGEMVVGYPGRLYTKPFFCQ